MTGQSASSASATTSTSSGQAPATGQETTSSAEVKTEIDPKEAGRILAKARHEKFVTDFKAKAGIKDPPPEEKKPEETKADPAASDHAANLANLARETRKLELARKQHEDKVKAENEALEAARKKLEAETAEDRAELERLKRVRALGKEGKTAEAYLEALGTEDVPVELLQELLERGGKQKYLSPDEAKAAFKEWYKTEREREIEEEKKQRDQRQQSTAEIVETNKTNFVFGQLKDPNGPRDDMANRQGGVAGYLTEHAAEYPALADIKPDEFKSRVISLADEYYKATKGQGPNGTGLIAQPKDILDYIEQERREEAKKRAERLGLFKVPPEKVDATSIDAADKRGADLVANEEEEQGVPDKFLPKEERDKKRAASEKSVKDKMAARLAEIRGGRK